MTLAKTLAADQSPGRRRRRRERRAVARQRRVGLHQRPHVDDRRRHHHRLNGRQSTVRHLPADVPRSGQDRRLARGGSERDHRRRQSHRSPGRDHELFERSLSEPGVHGPRVAAGVDARLAAGGARKRPATFRRLLRVRHRRRADSGGAHAQRRDCRLLQRLPAPRQPARGCRTRSRRQFPLRVSRVDLRHRRPHQDRAAAGTLRARCAHSGTFAAQRSHRRVGRLRVRFARSRSAAAARLPRPRRSSTSRLIGSVG